MSELLTLVTQSLEPLLAEECSPDKLRAYESGASVKPLWDSIHQLGFADVFIAEEFGGAGLSLLELGELLFLFGRYLLPIPLADTLVARSLLAAAGQEVPEGLVVLATAASSTHIHSGPVMLASVADYAMIDCPQGVVLLALKDRHRVMTGVSRSLAASIRVSGDTLRVVDGIRQPLRVIAATLRAAEMAGMLSRLLELSVTYTRDRNQFGKPLAKFQAIQQQLAVLAEETAAASMASRLAFQGQEFTLLRAAVAKMRASRAATEAAAIAHAVHGAMGFSEEYDLQLYSRRLLEAQMAEGAETYWARMIGRHSLECSDLSSLDFVRENLN